VLKQVLRGRHGVAVIGSEEEEELSFTDNVSVGDKRFTVLFGPLDGSPNLNVSGEVVTTFSIYAVEDASPYALRPDTQQVAAGYVL
jgi:fructose-1,6-bisphosphatase